MAHYFFSDVHLGYGDRASDRAREDRLLRFLHSIEGTAETVFVVGDLFDYWFDYKTTIPRHHVRTLAALADLVDRGIPVHYSIGNHDFGHRDFFAKELGVTMHADDYAITLSGKRFLISHGDGKALHDLGYTILKKILRNPALQRVYRAVHPDIGIGLAAWSSRSSRGYTDKKDYGNEVDGLELFAKKKLNEGFDFVVMGHRHNPLLIQEGKGTYINLGDWLHHNSYGVFDGTSMELRTFSSIS